MKKIFLIIVALLLTACNDNQQQGYVEARLRYISANFSGMLEKLNVARGTLVTAGENLFVLDPQPESDQFKQAQANVTQTQQLMAQTQAKLRLDELTLNRYKTLVRKKALDQSSLDTAQSNVDQTRAQFQQYQANLHTQQAALSEAQWQQQQKMLLAPVNAEVFDTYYLPGELVAANHPVLSLLTSKDIYVIFFVSEKKLGTLKIGQSLEVSCDGCGLPIAARITFISPQTEYTPPVIYSEQTRDKLVYRVEAQAMNERDAIRLHPGQPVNVKL